MIKIPNISIDKTNSNKPIKVSEFTKACNGQIYVRVGPKVVTDEHKLFGTKPNHKYY